MAYRAVLGWCSCWVSSATSNPAELDWETKGVVDVCPCVAAFSLPLQVNETLSSSIGGRRLLVVFVTMA